MKYDRCTCGVVIAFLLVAPIFAFAVEPDEIEFSWTPVPRASIPETLEMLANQTKGNYALLRSLQATYQVRHKQYLSEEFVSKSIGPHLRNIKPSPLIQEFEFTTKLAADIDLGAVFRSKQTHAMRYRRVDSNEIVKIEGVQPADSDSIVTTEHFVRFRPDSRWTTFSVLPDNPKAKNKRAAFRDAPEGAQLQDHGELLDPRAFFAFGTRKFWETLSVPVSMLKGERGEDLKKQIESVLTLYHSARPAGTWYRVKWTLSDGRGNSSTTTVIWSPLVGYHPVSSYVSKDLDAKQIEAITLWDWRLVENVYVPWRVRETSYKGPNGIPNYDRDVQTENCLVNRPLRADQFDYASLGLTDGDLIVDNIERIVNIMKDGKPVKLGAFGEKHTAPDPVRAAHARSRLSYISSYMVSGNLIILSILVTLYLLRRRRIRILPRNPE